MFVEQLLNQSKTLAANDAALVNNLKNLEATATIQGDSGHTQVISAIDENISPTGVAISLTIGAETYTMQEDHDATEEEWQSEFDDHLPTGVATISMSDTDLTDGTMTVVFAADFQAQIPGLVVELLEPAWNGSDAFDTGMSTTTGGSGEDNEVQNLALYDEEVFGGTFDMTFFPGGADEFDVLAIPYNVTAAQLESLINAAATAATIDDWTNGAIDVTGGPLDDADFDFEYTAHWELSNVAQATVDGENLQLWETMGAVPSGGENIAVEVLFDAGIFLGTKTDPENWTANVTRASLPVGFDENSIRDLIRDIAFNFDITGLEASLLSKLGYAPVVRY